MSLKMKLTSTICSFFLVLGLVIMGVMAAPSATVNLGGTISFTATNVYAIVTGKISGTAVETQPTLADITIDDKTVDGDISTWSSQNLSFKDDGSEITIEVTIENLATDRNLYAYITDAKGKVANVNKSMKQGETDYADSELITLDSTSNKTTITLSMEIADKNKSLAAGTLYGYNIVLMDISGFKTITEFETNHSVTFETNSNNKTAIVSSLFAWEDDACSDVWYAHGDIVVPPHIKDANNIVYTVTGIGNFGDGGMGADSMTVLVLPNTVSGSIPFFSYCKFSSFVIPHGITSIEPQAFMGCYSLSSVTIPSSVTNLGLEAFNECYNLANIYYQGTEEEWNAIEGIEDASIPDDCTINFLG